MDWAPGTSTLWTVVNERDMLGDDVPPNYLTSVRDGAFYGWGRPVGVTVGPDGSLLVADDAGGTCRG